MKSKLKLASLLAALTLSSVALADQVFPDDVIIQSSLCVGQDCANNEQFDFDTVRLKENNVRIAFDDTSSSQSFPRNDWRLAANDSANGGLNHFSIDDVTGGLTPFRVEAGAPQYALVVTEAGSGFGTMDPEAALHARTTDTPAIILEQSGQGGFTPAKWELAANEANVYLKDSQGGTLPFRIQSAAPTDSLVVMADGSLQSGGWNTAAGASEYVIGTDAGSALTLGADGSLTISGLLSEGSSATLKHNLRNTDDEAILETVCSMKMKRWQYLDDPSQAEHIGPIAEEFHAAFGVGSNEKRLASMDVAGVALASVRALNEKLETENQKLEAQNEALEARLARLEQLVRGLSAK